MPGIINIDASAPNQESVNKLIVDIKDYLEQKKTDHNI
jgi:hypothetical protein